jgi:hypothetical protein
VDTPPEDADAYLRYIDSTGIAAYKATAGNRGAWIFRRPSGDDRVEIVTLSFWDSLEAIRGFAGDDIERAVLYPEDELPPSQRAGRRSLRSSGLRFEDGGTRTAVLAPALWRHSGTLAQASASTCGPGCAARARGLDG